MITPESRYDDIATRIVPRNRTRTRAALRKDIALALEQTAKEAIRTEIVNQYPTYKSEQEVIRQAKSDLTAGQQALATEQAVIRRIVGDFHALLIALEKYLAWHNGQGLPEDQKVLWENLKDAYHRYRQLDQSA